ncbi:MAG: T9SS type A sorting domain-containing protein [Ignavibacteriales bacterium]|nr:MAG: T9SS type A sorting domain-containing protein [Ignavibacteriales bacterium]
MNKIFLYKGGGILPLWQVIMLFLLTGIMDIYPQDEIKLTNAVQLYGFTPTAPTNGLRNVQVSLGQAVVGNTFGSDRSISMGYWSFYLLPPNKAELTVSQGEFPNRIEVSWEFDILSPPADNDYFKVYRDGSLLATLPATQNYYIDYNVYPGTFYRYTVTGVNEFNESPPSEAIGFVNPNGIITGAISTQFGRPVHDVEVTVTPTLGKAMQFDGINDYIDAGNGLNIANKPFTIEFWLKRSANDSGMIFSQNVSDSALSSRQLFIGFNKPGNLLGVYGGVPAVTAVTEDFQWHHYAWVQDYQKDSGYIYRDAVQLLRYKLNGVKYNGTGRIVIGRSGINSTKYFKMQLDEMRVWEKALSQSEIKRNMRRTVNTNSPGLASYWKFDEGLGNLVFDLSPAFNNGNVLGGAVFTDDRGPVKTSAFSDTLGNYSIEGINYGSATNFSVTPVREGRLFNPPARIVTLSTSNTAANNIDFTDISAVPVSGIITHQGTSCFADSIEIYINGAPGNPRIFTNDQGKFIAEFEPGTTQTLTPVREGYTFNPAFITVRNIVDPIANANFVQTRTYSISGLVAGGDCDLPIGPSVIKLTSLSGACITREITTNSSGSFTISNLPPLRYRVEIDPAQPGITFNDDIIDLRDTSQIRNYRYYAPLQAEIVGLEPTEGCSTIVLDQFTKIPVRYRVYESYTYNGVTNICEVDTAVITIDDAISDKEGILRELTAIDGAALDTLISGYPNIIAPYTKRLQISAEHRDGRTAGDTLFAVVTGFKPRTNAFTTTSPAVPLLILRDPPGDASYSYFSNSTSLSNSLNMYYQSTSGTDLDSRLSLAPDFSFDVGFMYSVSTEIDLTLDITSSMSYTQTGTSATELSTTITTTENFSTADDDAITGDGGDVFIGGAMNLIYGVTDVLKYNGSCGFSRETSLVVSPNGFATTFIYTADYIENFVIPSLESINDTAGVRDWQRILDYNDSLKADAEYSRNISFSSGATAEYIESTEQTNSRIFEFDMTVDASVGLEVGATINGIGGVGGFTFRTGFGAGRSSSSTVTTINEVGFSLRDDDVGDAFSVNVYKDRVYGTPVFSTVSGQSSCPWEEGTVARDSMGLLTDNSIAVNVHPDSFAVFNLSLQNLGQLNESREFQLRVLNETNESGAVIAVNGIVLQGGLNFTVQPMSQVNAVLTVKRGPQAYIYENIGIVLTSPCEWDANAGQDLSIADTLFISVRFLEPCSEIAIDEPEPNWLINRENADDFTVKLWKYNRGNPSLQEVVLRYRQVPELAPSSGRKNLLNEEGEMKSERIFKSSPLASMRYQKVIDYSSTDRYSILRNNPDYASLFASPQNSTESWTVIATIPRDSLPLLQDYVIVPFDTEGLSDGSYELQALAVCAGNTLSGTSALVQGIIDKTSPAVLGQPKPVNGVLGANDEISVTFTEQISCESVNAVDNLMLINTQTGQMVDFNYSCNGQTIVITPNVQNRFIENRVLKAVVKRVRDMNGNILRVPFGTEYRDSVAWEFLVDRNPVRWSGGEVEVVKFADEIADIQRQLLNEGGTAYPYTITNFPNWMSLTPVTGTVQTQGAVTVNFRFGNMIAPGTYEDTVYASTLNGDEPMIVKLRVLCRPPQWSVNPAMYEYSMNITARLYVDTTLSNDIYDRVAVYAGTQLRGAAAVTRLNNTSEYRVFLTIYSNQTQGEALTFRVWDASSCTEYGQILESFTFKSDTLLGNIANPVRLTATSQIIQQYPLSAGWNWVSFNTVSASMRLNDLLGGVSHANGDNFKTQSAFSQYSGSLQNWFGTLDTLDLETYYLWKRTTPAQFLKTGYAVRPDQRPIMIDSGWNWIGYIPQFSLPVNEALRTLNPKDGDVIKSQFQFAIYDQNFGWFGDLQFMIPQIGYLLRLDSRDTLLYPQDPPVGTQPAAPVPQYVRQVPASPDWIVDASRYETSMNIIAAPDAAWGDTASVYPVAGLFSGNECRGFARTSGFGQDKKPIYLITVYGSAGSSDTLELRLLDEATGAVRIANLSIIYTANSVAGSLQNPLIIHSPLSSAEDMTGLPAEYILEQNYPNPFNPSTNIRFGLPEAGDVEVSIYNIMGEKVRGLVKEYKQAGYYTVSWNARNENGEMLPTGIYFTVMKSGSFTQTRKIVFLK